MVCIYYIMYSIGTYKVYNSIFGYVHPDGLTVDIILVDRGVGGIPKLLTLCQFS